MKRTVASVLAMMSIGTMGLAQSPAAPGAPASWTDALTFKGDLRYRYETRDDKSALNAAKETYTRQLNRIRARLGAEAKCNDNLKAGLSLTTSEGTGTGDPISGNQTLTGGDSKKPIWVDLAYLDYNFFGDNPNEVHAIAGKMKNPFMTMPDDLVWDGDMTPEGVAVKSQLGGGLATLFLNGGYVWVQERKDNDDSMLYAGQAAVKVQFVPEVALTVGGSYYGFQDIQGYDLIDYQSPASSYGNSTKNGSVSGSTTNKAWASEFTPVVYFAQLDVWVARLPIAVFAQELSNSDADQFDQGHMYGVSVGKAKNPKTWEIGYSRAELQKDATVGMWTDSDRWGGGTDGKGDKFVAKYQIMKNLQLGATYFANDKGIADAAKTKDYNRMQLDLVAAF